MRDLRDLRSPWQSALVLMVVLVVGVSLLYDRSILNLTDFTSGMNQNTILTTMNANNAAIESAFTNIDGTNIVNNSIGSGEVIDNSLTQSDLGPDSVCTSEIAASCVTLSEQGANSVDSSKVVDSSIATSDILNGTILLEDLNASVTGLLTQQTGRLGLVPELSTAAEAVYVGDVRSAFTGTSLSNAAMVSTVYCKGSVGMIYLLENNSTTDRVHRVLSDSMTAASPATVNLGSGDDPIDMACAPDGSLYVLTDGASKVIKKLSTSGTLTTFYDMTAGRNVDGVVRIHVDPNGVAVLVTGQDNTIGQDRMVFKMLASDPNQGGSVAVDSDTDTNIFDGMFAKKNGSMRFWPLMQELGADINCCLRPVDYSPSPPTVTVGGDCDAADDFLVLASGVGAADCQSVLFDGHAVIVSSIDSDGDGAGLIGGVTRFFDNGVNQGTLENNPAWAAGTDLISGDFKFGVFTGKYFAWQRGSSSALVNLLAPPYYSSTLAITNLDYRGNQGGTVFPAGVTTDGVNLYVTTRNTGGTAFTVTKNVM